MNKIPNEETLKENNMAYGKEIKREEEIMKKLTLELQKQEKESKNIIKNIKTHILVAKERIEFWMDKRQANVKQQEACIDQQ